MKKVLAMFLALVLVLSMSTVALASSGVTGDTEQNIVVTVTEGEVNHIRSINIEWDSLVFTYTKGDKTWNPGQQKYDEAAGTWGNNRNTATVTVTNKSDEAITVSAAITGQDDKDGFSASLSAASFTLESYATQAAGQPDKGTITITVSLASGEGEPSGEVTVGTVELTIS